MLHSSGMKSSEDILGETYIYPGHPVVVAYCIVQCFATYSEAMEKDPISGYRAALTSLEIPGSSNSVQAAIYMLKRLHKGDMTPEVAITWADGIFAEETNNKLFSDRLASGQEQADRFKDKLLTALTTWLVSS